MEVRGIRDNHRVEHILTSHHPASDGSVPGWENLRAYTRSVGIPMAIGVQLMAEGQIAGDGVLTPERAFGPADVFQALKKRGIEIKEEVRELGPI